MAKANPKKAKGAEPTQGMLLVPQPSQFRTILLNDDDYCEEGFKRTSHLYFPEMVFSILYTSKSGHYTLNRLQVAFSKTPFTGERSEETFGLPLGNLDEGF